MRRYLKGGLPKNVYPEKSASLTPNHNWTTVAALEFIED